MITVYDRLEDIKKIVKKADETYIYGAGAYAYFLTKEFEKEGIIVAGYLVSSAEGDNLYDLKNVSKFSDVEINDEVIVIGVQQPEFVKEIEAQLSGVKNVVRFNPETVTWQYVNREEAAQASRISGYFSSEKKLQVIGAAENTDKAGSHHNYLNKYEFFLNKFKEEEFTFVELGVFRGGSIKMWRKFFSKAKVIGVDIDENCLQYATDDIEILIKDLSLDESIKEISQLKPSVIVDDASHLWSHQINALLKLYPTLPSGGVYILEDISTSFFPTSYYYKDAKVSAYHLIEVISKGVVGDSVEDVDYTDFEDVRAEIDEVVRTTEVVVNMADSVLLIRR